MRQLLLIAIVAAGCALILIGGRKVETKPASTCCASVDFHYKAKGANEYHLVFNNHSGKQIVAYTFERGDRQDGTLLFGAAIPEGEYEENLLMAPKDGELKLISVLFDDESFEGDAKVSQWNLTAIKAAQEENTKRVGKLRECVAGRISAKAVDDEIGEFEIARSIHGMTGEEMAADLGRQDVRLMHKKLLQASVKNRNGRDLLAGSIDALENRYRLLRGSK